MSDREEDVDGRIPQAALYLRIVAKGQPDPLGSVGLRPAKAPTRALNARTNASTEALRAHPEDETARRFLNVTHYRSLRLSMEVLCSEP